MEIARGAQRTTYCAQPTAIRRGKVRLRIEHMCACRIGLHDRELAKRHAKRCTSESHVDTRSEFRKKLRRACEIVRCLSRFLPLVEVGREGQDAKREVQPARLDDDGGVQPVDCWIVGEPYTYTHIAMKRIQTLAKYKSRSFSRPLRCVDISFSCAWRPSTCSWLARCPCAPSAMSADRSSFLRSARQDRGCSSCVLPR